MNIKIHLTQDIIYFKSVKDATQAKLTAVGDDWQSIYRFTGCDISLFTEFDKYFKSPEILHIENTYRNSQQLIDITSEFITKS